MQYLTSSFEDFKQFVIEQFVPACKAKGLEPLLKELDTNKLAAVRSKNGVKTEVKLIRGNLSLIAGYGNTTGTWSRNNARASITANALHKFR